MNNISLDKTKKRNILEIIDKKKRIVYHGTEEELKKYLKKPRKYEIHYLAKNTFIDLLDCQNVNARIEPGAIIREKVKIGKNAIILPGAVINVNAKIGDDTMIDMGTIIGSGAIIGKRCHIGAGSVVSGVMEPVSNNPVIIEDDVFIGASVTILPGLRIGSGSVIGAGSVVTKNVEPKMVVVGNPARILKNASEVDSNKVEINVKLR